MELQRLDAVLQFVNTTEVQLANWDAKLPNGVLVYCPETRIFKLGQNDIWSNTPVFLDLNDVELIKQIATFLQPQIDNLTLADVQKTTTLESIQTILLGLINFKSDTLIQLSVSEQDLGTLKSQVSQLKSDFGISQNDAKANINRLDKIHNILKSKVFEYIDKYETFKLGTNDHLSSNDNEISDLYSKYNNLNDTLQNLINITVANLIAADVQKTTMITNMQSVLYELINFKNGISESFDSNVNTINERIDDVVYNQNSLINRLYSTVRDRINVLKAMIDEMEGRTPSFLFIR